MGVNNYLWIPVAEGGQLAVQFRWGFCWEDHYEIGDRLPWPEGKRPGTADGRVEVGAVFAIFPDWVTVVTAPEEHELLRWRYFAITLEDDIFVGAREISEAEYEALYKERRNDMR